MLKGLVGSKSLTRDDMESVLDKMRDHLIGMILHPPVLFSATFKNGTTCISFVSFVVP